jgi:hypothetical protein
MRIIAIILNVILLIVIVVLIAKEGFPGPEDEGFLFDLLSFLLIVLTPIVSLVALLLEKSGSWLSLYFRRKAVEEKARIAKLDREMNSQQTDPGDKQ